MTKLPAIDNALQHFACVDATMHCLLDAAVSADAQLAVPYPKSQSEYFPTLVRSIVSQQISTSAAASVFARLTSTVTLTPEAVMTTADDTLRECGLSKQKVRYIQSLADAWDSLESETFVDTSDIDIIKRLSACYGIGVWTAEMFLLFAMARPDVFSVGDLALRQQVARHYGVESNDYAAIRSVSEVWSPHRTLSSLALWHEIDNGPVLL